MSDEKIEQENKQEDKKVQYPSPEDWERFREKLKKSEMQKSVEFLQQLATREKLERDYKEDIIRVTFETSPETKRTVLARRPTHKEMIKIIEMVVAASSMETPTDKEGLKKLAEVYKELPKMAAMLCIDKKLDEKFWSEKVSLNALQNFLNEVIAAAQAPGLTKEELESFRR